MKVALSHTAMVFLLLILSAPRAWSEDAPLPTHEPPSRVVEGEAPFDDEPWEPWDGATLWLQAVGGVGGVGLLGFGLGGGAYLLFWDGMTEDELSGNSGASVVFWLAGVGGAGGGLLGVQLAGDWMGGDGDRIWTSIGGGLGGILGMTPGLVGDGDLFVEVIGLGAGMVLGSILGYHLSASAPDDSEGVMLAPSVVMHREQLIPGVAAGWRW